MATRKTTNTSQPKARTRVALQEPAQAPAAAPVALAPTPVAEKAPSGDLKPVLLPGYVMASVAKAFTLTRDDHQKVEYPMGTLAMPKADAEHWYAKAHGVKIIG